jgi:hypothetical protein
MIFRGVHLNASRGKALLPFVCVNSECIDDLRDRFERLEGGDIRDVSGLLDMDC